MAPGLVLDTRLYRNLAPEAKQAVEQYGSRSITDGAGIGRVAREQPRDVSRRE